MTGYAKEFFAGKRPWSRVKDFVLGSYMKPYTAKLIHRGQPLLLIDAFAGPGKFDGDGSPGSPLIMCEAAQKNASGRYQALFINQEFDHHNQLDSILKAGGWYPSAQAIYGNSQDFLRSVEPILKTQSVFLYLDPFGLKDFEFETLNPFLNRNHAYSTEIMITLCAPALHRHAGRQAIAKAKGIISRQIERGHRILTRSLGGDYWQEFLLSDNDVDTKARELGVVNGFKQKLASTGYLTYTGSCPVVQGTGKSRTKYYMIFASGHPDAMILLNDSMCKAYNGYIYEYENQGTLFAGLTWKDWRDTSKLPALITEYVKKYPGYTRRKLWFEIIRDHFMEYTESEYIEAVMEAVNLSLVESPTPRATKRLNDDCVLYPKGA